MIHLQVVDTSETAVVKHQNIYFLSFLHDGHDLAVEHKETGIAYHTVNLVLWLCKFHAQGCSHFISHARIAVLCMIAASLVCGPHSLHTAWKGTACCDNRSVLVNHSANGCQSRCLGDFSACHLHKLWNGSRVSCFNQRLKIFSCILNASQMGHFLIPFGLSLFYLVCIGGNVSFFSQFLCQSV